MQLHGCSCFLKQRGLGATGRSIVASHYCWDGKTKVINDSDCPPQPVAAPSPAPAPTYTPSPPPTPILTDQPTQTIQPVRSTPPPTLQREAYIPQVMKSDEAPPASQVVTMNAAGAGSTVAPVGAEDSAPTDAPAPESSINWAALLAIAVALYNFS